jgi:hypothetical protein
MTDLPTRRSLLNKVVAATMAPIFLLGSVFNALPASAQVAAASRAVLGNAGASAVRPVPAALGGVQGLPVLPAPAVLAGLAAAPVLAAPSIRAAQAAAAPLAAAPAAAVPALAAAAAAAPSISASPDGPARISGEPAAGPRDFVSLLNRFASLHAPMRAVLRAAGLFDGTAGREVLSAGVGSPEAGSAPLGVLPHSTPPEGHSVREFLQPSARSASDGARGIALDADPQDPASIEKALRALVDSAPGQFGAPSSQMGKISVSILPSIQPGQGASIIAVFRQGVVGADKDGRPYELDASGQSLTFHIKVFKDGKPVVMSLSGGLAAGVNPDVMTVRFDDEQLLDIATRRAQAPADARLNLNGRAGVGKTALAVMAERLSRSGSQAETNLPAGAAGAASARASVPAAPKYITRVLTNELDGNWRAINIYTGVNPDGKRVIVIVDVKTGEAFVPPSAQDVHTGNELISGSVGTRTAAARRTQTPPAEARPAGTRPTDGSPANRIFGTVTGRGTTATADGGDHGPIAPIPVPLTNAYDESGKVVAVTDEQGDFSIPADGNTSPVKLTFRLASPFVPFVTDEDAKQNGPVEVTVMVKPGEKMNVMLNPVGDNPESAATITGYVGYLRHHIWMRGLPGIDAARMDVPLAGGMVTNGSEEKGNAFYDPATDSVNLMKAAIITVRGPDGRPMQLKVENTAVLSIDDHENTHRVVQIYAQRQLTPAQTESPVYRFVKWSIGTIMGADVNEAIADFVSYCMRRSPIIGDGFFSGNPPAGQPDYIRSALEKTTYDPKNPDPHNGVLAQAMWAARAGFIERLGQAPGEAYANALIPLIVTAQPLNPIDALFHMLLWDLREDGSSPFGSLIRRIAKDDHGIDLPATPAAPVPMA